MQEVNYIHHLNEVLELFSRDGRLNPSHVSLYMALFRFWNLNYFRPSFFIQREEVMVLAKLGSKSTYHRCLTDLSNWSYILYEPSHNPFKGSRVYMFEFDVEEELDNCPTSETTSGQVVNSQCPESETSTGQALVSINKPIQTVTNKKNSNKTKKFKNQKKGNAGEKKNKQKGSVPYTDNLHTTTDKNYDEPL
ncbi:hypothetical protein SAMN05216480_12513 [Pustulibacterium marinum]|uniref:Uncharacterized protein n=2 Tax=Pustulibacterium marinum TaxID=1224947 RepID=A0A1I7IYK5_9FLAO|nr:hypothetical protein SAMN05216480_12513 [Pustulibacterium marinum]